MASETLRSPQSKLLRTLAFEGCLVIYFMFSTDFLKLQPLSLAQTPWSRASGTPEHDHTILLCKHPLLQLPRSVWRLNYAYSAFHLNALRALDHSWRVKGWPLSLTLGTLSSVCLKGPIFDIFLLTLRYTVHTVLIPRRLLPMNHMNKLPSLCLLNRLGQEAWTGNWMKKWKKQNQGICFPSPLFRILLTGCFPQMKGTAPISWPSP